jgi:hypothetical protein
MLESAKWYTKRGFSVIPLSPGTKIPPKGFPVLEHRGYIATDEQLEDWFSKPANIAICPSGFDALDFDRGDWLEVAASLGVEDTFSYSTSRGGHIWVRGWNGTKMEGVDHKTQSGYVVVPPSIVGGVKYQWRHRGRLEDLRVTNLPIVAREDSKKINIYTDSSEGGSGGKQHYAPRQMFLNGSRDEDLFHTANCLIRGGMHEDNVSQVLERAIQTWGETQPDHENKKWVADKISSALKRSETSARNIAEETREAISTTTGPFRTTELHKILDLRTKDDKNACTKEVQRMATAGMVVATGRINGEYRLLDRQLVKLDWEKADPTKALDIAMPFNIAPDLVNLYSKNITVIAGSPDAGKSAYMLNIVALNMHKWKVRYFTSEMSEQELHLRLSKFEGIPKNKWKFDAYERGSDYGPVIDPNGLNIIDYLEVHENFHLVARWLDEIFQKLKHGVAFVALQKKRNTKDQQYDVGRGAEFSLERPRLYLAMDNGCLKIVKAKNRTIDTVNPNGKEFRFKLVGGCKFIETDGGPHDHAELLKDDKGLPYVGRRK